jgi:hypothetical protein
MNEEKYDNEAVIAEIYVPTSADARQIEVSDENAEIEYAKENIRKLIESGTSSLSELALLSSQLEQPKGYEALSTMLKTLTDMNKTLVEISEKRSLKTPTVNKNNIENVFFGTTKEVLEMLLNPEAK